MDQPLLTFLTVLLSSVLSGLLAAVGATWAARRQYKGVIEAAGRQAEAVLRAAETAATAARDVGTTSERTAMAVAHISRENQLLIDRDRARRDFRSQQTKGLLEHANGRFGSYRRTLIAAVYGDVDAFDRARKEIIDGAALADMSFSGVMDAGFVQAGRRFTEADQALRARVIEMEVRPARSVRDVENVGRQLEELDELSAPLFMAIIELNRAAEAYVFGQPSDAGHSGS